MTDLRTLRRAGGDALRLLVDLLPPDWDPRSGEEETSIVFADVSGYSDFVAATGDDTALLVLAALDDAVAGALNGRKGARVVKRLGDGIMLAARRAGDGPAIAAELVAAFERAAQSHEWPLRLRAGVHRGVVRRQGEDRIGYHVNLAARVAEAAPPGRTLASEAALAGVDLAREGLAARPAGRLHAKGVNGPVAVRTVWPDPAARRAAS
ncbi:MAG TPA: adenylate/guanylate cyclase domain-containing protein [Egibacteraceae bacterium]|nr:adenylate/guanylate cyclase domain-containing protein [Egibacteraceae bacterium]